MDLRSTTDLIGDIVEWPSSSSRLKMAEEDERSELIHVTENA